MDPSLPSRTTLLAAAAVALIVLALLAVLVGEPFVAGVLMLLTAFVIYVRETRL